MSPTATMHTAMNQSTPKRNEKGKGKAMAIGIDIIEISDDSDPESDSAAGAKLPPTRQRKPLHSFRHANNATAPGFGSPSKSPSKPAFRSLSTALSPGAYPSPSPFRSATTRTRTRKTVDADVDVIDISSDSDNSASSGDSEPAASRPSPSPAKRCRVDHDHSGPSGAVAPDAAPKNRRHSGAHIGAARARGAVLDHQEGTSGSRSSARDAVILVQDVIQKGAATDTDTDAGMDVEDLDARAQPNPVLARRTRAFLPPPAASESKLTPGQNGDGESAQPPAEDNRPSEIATPKQNVDYEDTNRDAPSDAYRKLSLHYLRLAFPFLPKNIIAAALYQHDGLYAPTYLHLRAAEQRYSAVPPREERPYRCNATRYAPTAARRALAQVWDEAFGAEWMWVEARLGRSIGAVQGDYATMRAGHCVPSVGVAAGLPSEATPVMAGGAARAGRAVQVPVSPGARRSVVPDNGKGKQRAVDADVDMNMDVDIAPVQEDSAEDSEDGDIECGCCFAEYTFDKMVQCPDGHLFCAHCVSQYAATQLGAHNPALVCMDTVSGCTLAFPESELRRVLAPGLMALYARLGAQRAVAAAGLEGLEECPFCDWKCVVDGPVDDSEDGLFRCGNGEGGCGAVSCRRCKKKDHRPKTCQEMEQDQVLNGQHAIEEAMTRALMRNCPNPKCNKAFIKEAGCNKMTCPYCHTYSCYVCRKTITGYDHFGRGGCPANDNVLNRHAIEVRAAAKKAVAELKLIDPDIDHAAITVDLPLSPAQLAVRRHEAQQRRQAEQQRLQQQKLLVLQRRQEQFQDLFRRQELLRQEDLRRQREREMSVVQREGEEEEDGAGEERRQQQRIAEQARRAVIGRQTAIGALQREGPVGGPPSASASRQSDPYARAYAHAFNMLHGRENGVGGPSSR